MLEINFFRGAKPKIESHLLSDGEAQKAVNCRLENGALKPFQGTSVVQALSLVNAKTIHKFGDTSNWFEFSGNVDVTEGPLASDTETTTYFTGDGLPSMTYASIATSGAAPYPSNRYTLGVPAPENAPTATVSGVATGGDETLESRSYVYTYVSARGEEGPPSLPSPIVDLLEGQSVTLSAMDAAPTGAYNIATKRIYRTSTSSGDTSFLYVGEIPVATASHVDDLATESLGGLLPSSEWYPPNDEMIGLTSCPNGVLAGFKGKELYLSEPYLPHAWPYSITVDRPIVGLVAIQGGLVVATDGQPVLVSFAHPSAASQIIIENPRACVSKRSMVDMGEFAVYSTSDGLVRVDGSGRAPIITQNIMDRYEWGKLNPETIHAYRFENWYVAFYQGVEGSGGFAITPDGEGFIELDFYAETGFTDPKEGDLYLVVGTNIVKWDDDAGSLLSYVWKSRTVLLPKPKNMAAARVDAENYPVVFALYSDGALLYSRSVNNERPFWLPANFLTRRYDVELSGINTVRRVVVAESMEELS